MVIPREGDFSLGGLTREFGFFSDFLAISGSGDFFGKLVELRFENLNNLRWLLLYIPG